MENKSLRLRERSRLLHNMESVGDIIGNSILNLVDAFQCWFDSIGDANNSLNSELQIIDKIFRESSFEQVNSLNFYIKLTFVY